MKQTIRPYARLICLVTAFLHLVSPHAAAETNEQTFKFYGNQNVPPMIFLEGGSPTGLVSEIMRELTKRVPETIEFKAMDWAEAQAIVRSGVGDGLVQINKNADRETYLAFSDPLVRSEFSIFKYRNNLDIHSIENLKGRTVGVEAAGYPISLLRRYPDINIQIVDDWKTGFELVRDKKIDAVVVDRWVGEYVLAQNDIRGVAVAGMPIEILQSHIAVRKELEGLLSSINAGLTNMRADGTMDRILEKWSGTEVIYISRQKDLVLKATISLATLLAILTLSFGYIIRQRRRSIDALEAERMSLDQRVKERTRELEIKRMEAEIANRTKSEFMASVSHELRTPLNAVIGFAQLLEMLTDKQGVDPEKTKKYAQAIGRSGNILLALINDVLDLAKIEGGQFLLSQDLFYLNEELVNIASAFEAKAMEHNVTLTVDIAERRSIILRGDALRFRQVIFNLLDNAIKFSRGKTVTVTMKIETLAKERTKITIKVVDTGIGIEADRLDLIFEPFRQNDSSIARQFGGSGLGLSISRKLARLMGGDLIVESQRGTGSTFTATFEFEDVSGLDQDLARLKDQTNKTENFSLDLRVLAVDDNEENLDVIAALLDELGCQVSLARSGREAMAAAQEHAMDLILMDLHMPDVDGMKAASQIQSTTGPNRTTPIIAWTADVSSDRLLEASNVDWAGKLLKPTTHASLVAVLSQRHH